jgi:hypothetical protein
MKHERTFSVNSQGESTVDYPVKITSSSFPDQIPDDAQTIKHIPREGFFYHGNAWENSNFYVEDDRVYDIKAQEWHQLEPGDDPLDLIDRLQQAKKV